MTERKKPLPPALNHQVRLIRLAYLGWCVQYGVDFMGTVVHHMKKKTGQTFTEKQIKRQLARDCRVSSKSQDVDGLLSMGPAGLDKLGLRDGRDVARLVCELGEPPRPRRLRSSGIDPPGDGEPKGQEPNTQESSGSQKSNGTQKPGGVRKPKKSAPKGKATSSKPRGSPKSSQKVQQQGSGARRCVIKLHTKTSLSQPRPQPTFVDISDDEPAPDPPSAAQGDCPALEAESQSITQSITFPSLPETIPPVNKTLPLPEPPQVGQSSTGPQTTQADSSRLQCQNFRLENENSWLRRELNEARECNEAHARDGPAMQSSLRQQIALLKKNIAQVTTTFKATAAVETNTLGLSRTNTVKEFDCLFQDIRDVSLNVTNVDLDDESRNPLQQRFDESAQTWALRVSGLSPGQLLLYGRAEGLPANLLFTSLMAAGISELVFESVLPEMLNQEYQPLDYRRFISTHFGPAALRKADLVTLSWLTSEPSFEAVTSEKANSLANFFVRTLHFFLSPESHNLDQRHVLNEEESQAVADLHEVLSKAIGFKSRLSLSQTRFKFYFFQPGQPFDPAAMNRVEELDPLCGLQGRGPQTDVRLCVFPAVYAVPPSDRPDRGVEGIPHSLASAQCLAQATVRELQSLQVVVKAVVVV